MSQNNTPLTVKHRIGYALGDFGGCMTFSLMSAFMTRYYVNVALMDTAVIAAMTLIWKVFDALSNPVIGVMMDKSFAKDGGPKRRYHSGHQGTVSAVPGHLRGGQLDCVPVCLEHHSGAEGEDGTKARRKLSAPPAPEIRWELAIRIRQQNKRSRNETELRDRF